jgi:hypothetical protein
LRNLPLIGLPTRAQHCLLPTIAALGDTRAQAVIAKTPGLDASTNA